MVKFLIISVLIIYILYKVFGFIFRALFFTLSGRQHHQKRKNNTSFYTKKPVDGNVEIKYNPTENGQQQDKKFKGGEYVDYEDVK